MKQLVNLAGMQASRKSSWNGYAAMRLCHVLPARIYPTTGPSLLRHCQCSRQDTHYGLLLGNEAWQVMNFQGPLLNSLVLRKAIAVIVTSVKLVRPSLVMSTAIWMAA